MKIKEFLNNVMVWTLIKFHTIMIYFSIALRNVEVDIFSAGPDLNESNKKNIRKIHRNPLLEKFYAGKRDEKYVQDYYQLLKKADKFLLEATHHQMAVAGDKNAMNVGRPDKHGRVVDHIGFFKEGHKNVGKTMGAVLEEELLTRRTEDDNYELLSIVNNKAIETGLVDVYGEVGDVFDMGSMATRTKKLKFPIRVVRENVAINKIEELSEYMHIKYVADTLRQLEFFIPLKFKTKNILEDDKLFKEIVNFEQIYFDGKYGDLIGYNITDFKKRIIFNETHEVWIFKANEMETVKRY